MIQNLQCNATVHIRMQEESDGTVILDLVEHKEGSSKFRNLATIFVPQQHRENVANYLRQEDDGK